MTRTWVAIVACLGLASCGDNLTVSVQPDASMPPDAAPPDSAPDTPPLAAVLYPPRPAMTTADSVVIRGTVWSSREIFRVEVNGVLATTDDDYASWRAEVPIDVGVNQFQVDVVTVPDNRYADTALVPVVYRSELALQTPVDVVLDADQGRALVVDDGHDALIAVDLTTGVNRVVSSDARGAGPSIASPSGVALDAASNRALVIDDAIDAVLAIDLATGDRTIVSGPTVGAGPALDAPRDISLGPAGARLLVVDSALDALLSVELTTGDRAVVSDAVTGTGAALADPRGVALAADGATALVGDRSLRALLSVDLATGNRTVVSDSSDPGEEIFNQLDRVEFAPTPGFALVIDRPLGGVHRVDLATGERTLLVTAMYEPGIRTGTGLIVGDPRGIAVDVDGGRLLLADAGRDLVIAVDATGRAATPWAVHGRQVAVEPTAVAVDADARTAWAVDRRTLGIIEIDLETGQQRMLSRDESAGALRLQAPRDVVKDLSGDRLLVAEAIDEEGEDWFSYVVGVDVATGEREDLTSAGNGRSLELVASVDVVMPGQAVVVNSNPFFEDVCGESAVMLVDLATGDRTDVSVCVTQDEEDCDVHTGLGTLFSLPEDVLVDPASNRVLLTDTEIDAVLSVDLATGDRQVVAHRTIGSGPELPGPRSIEWLQEPDLALVVDRDMDALLRLDVATGDREVVSGSSVGSGVSLSFPEHAIPDRAPGVALVSDPGNQGVVMVDLVTGARLMLWH